MTAYVGGSQTSHLVPKVLQSLSDDIEEIQSQQPPKVDVNRNFEEKHFPNIDHISDKRWSHGGLPVWQMVQIGKSAINDASGRKQRLQRKQPSELVWLLASVTIVAIPSACAISISWLTPTEGFGCRTVTQLSFLLIWILSAAVDRVLSALFPNDEKAMNSFKSADTSRRSWRKDFTAFMVSWRRTRLYWLIFFKDFLFMSGIIVLLTFTALGIFNSCNCWTKWGPYLSQRYISFPQEQYVFDLIKRRLQTTFPAIVIFALLSQIFIFIAISIYFAEGHRVLKQRDIEDLKNGPGFLIECWRSFPRTAKRYWEKFAKTFKCQWRRFSRCVKRYWQDLPRRNHQSKPKYMSCYSSISTNGPTRQQDSRRKSGVGTVHLFELNSRSLQTARYG